VDYQRAEAISHSDNLHTQEFIRAASLGA
jgi:hypothetical protein